MRLPRWVVVLAVMLTLFVASCADDDEAERLDQLTTDLWIDQVTNFEVPDFCNDPDSKVQLPALLTDQYAVAAEDVEAVASRLIKRCEAAG